MPDLSEKRGVFLCAFADFLAEDADCFCFCGCCCVRCHVPFVAFSGFIAINFFNFVEISEEKRSNEVAQFHSRGRAFAHFDALFAPHIHSPMAQNSTRHASPANGDSVPVNSVRRASFIARGEVTRPIGERRVVESRLR